MKQRVNVPFWLPLIFFHLLSNCALYLLGTLSAPGTAFSDLAIFLARSFCFPASYNLPPTHPEQFRQPTFSLHARTKAARIRYSYCPSSIRPDTKKPAAFSGRRLKSTVERSTITGNPDSQGSEQEAQNHVLCNR